MQKKSQRKEGILVNWHDSRGVEAAGGGVQQNRTMLSRGVGFCSTPTNLAVVT